ncbi:hypothetical protein PHLGIDRAFT_226893 [Phlebiopsis gigantea 11061_1 CR5-6]|uniref:NAD(P)-binding protein n=1 Tax=Phlebiopsis gigantea (strain 11061_1 CR5-6) TaxID=745531 RepID=A0A0C3PE65_PHLG1|nr:hypothetical protein PHLGIDRAFT_226893 [Phlebiopsis gigantea 11061_1 CR5-6]
MANKLEQRVWLITGANSGLGLAIASYVSSRGDKVIATVRSLDKFPRSLKDQGASPLVLDLMSPDDEIKLAAEKALQVHGHVDVLVNNAGWGIPSPWEEVDLNEVRAQFQTMFFGTIAFTQALLPHFRTRRTGYVLNVSSLGSFLQPPSWGAYCSAKAAMSAFTNSLHTEMKPFGVQVLDILPGYFPTPFMFTAGGKSTYKPSVVYTDPSQGYGGPESLHNYHREVGLLGDVGKLAERIFEVVTKTGMAEDLVMKEGQVYDWTMIPLGADTERAAKEKLVVMLDNINGTEALWRSVNMDPKAQKLVPKFTNSA